MTYFAQIVGGVVASILVAPSAEWCAENIGGVWLEVRKDGSIRGKYPAIGDVYDAATDSFISHESES